MNKDGNKRELVVIPQEDFARLEMKVDRLLMKFEQVAKTEVSTKEALELLGLSPNNGNNSALLRNMRETGVLKNWRQTGNRFFYERRELERVAQTNNLRDFR